MKFLRFCVVLLSVLTTFSIQAQCDLNFDYTNTGSNMTAFFTPDAADDIASISESGTLGAFYETSSGAYVCASSMSFNGNQVQLPLMANDATTLEKDGFDDGDVIYWFYQSENGNVYELNTDPYDAFVLNSISIINQVSNTVLDCGSTTVDCEPLITEYTNTGANMTLFVTPNAASSISDLGTGTLAVFYTNNQGEEICAGSSLINGGQTSFPAMADDATTVGKDGFENGDALIWKFQADGGAQYLLSPSPNDAFVLNAISFVNSFTSEALCEGNPEPVEGCTDINACNFNADAQVDDGSCTYPEESIDVTMELNQASWGGALTESIQASIVENYEDEYLGCYGTSIDYAGSIALIERGSCQFSLKALNAQNAGAIAVVIYNNDGGLMNMGAGGYASQVSIPVFSMSEWDGQDLSEILQSNTSPMVTLSSQALTLSSMASDCEGNCINDADGDGVCDEMEIVGCTDASACNYNPNATDNGDCAYAMDFYDCDENCLNDTDADGVCDEYEVLGCMDMYACNYNADATDHTDCVYADEYYSCEGVCINDSDADGVCNELEVYGCTDMYAQNFNSEATEDDGSCEYQTNCGCTNPNYVEYYSQGFIADCDNGSCATLVENYDLTASHFNEPINTSVNMTLGFDIPYNPALEGAQFAAFYDLNGDGLISDEANFNDFGAMYYEVIGMVDYQEGFFVMPLWGDDPLTEVVDGVPSSSTEVLFALLTSDGNVVAFNPEPEFSGFEPNGLVAFENLNFDVTIYGCTDSNYCNFNPDAEEDDGSCEGLFGCMESSYMEYNANASCPADEACLILWQDAYNATVGQLNESLETINNLENELSAMNLANETLSIALEDEQLLNANLESQVNDLNVSVANLEAEVVSLNSMILSLNEELELMNSALVEALDENTELTAELTSLTNQVEELNGLVSSYQLELIELSNQNSELGSLLETALSELAISTTTVAQLTMDLEDALNANAECSEEVLGIQSQFETLSAEYDMLMLALDSALSPIEIDFIEGWNIIGYTLKHAQDAVASFDEINSILSVAKNNAGEVYWPEFGFNGIGDLIPGQGYQVRVDEAYNGFVFQDVNGLRIELQATVPQWAIDMEVMVHPNDVRSLVKVVNNLGQEVNPEDEFEGTVLYYLYNDGSVEKQLK